MGFFFSVACFFYSHFVRRIALEMQELWSAIHCPRVTQQHKPKDINVASPKPRIFRKLKYGKNLILYALLLSARRIVDVATQGKTLFFSADCYRVQKCINIHIFSSSVCVELLRVDCSVNCSITHQHQPKYTSINCT